MSKLLSAKNFEEKLREITGDQIPDEIADEFDFLEPYSALWRKDDFLWEGYEVFSPHFQGKIPVIGLLNVILLKDGVARLATEDETLQYLDFSEKRELGKKSVEEIKNEVLNRI